MVSLTPLLYQLSYVKICKRQQKLDVDVNIKLCLTIFKLTEDSGD